MGIRKDGDILPGQQYDRALNVQLPFTEQMLNTPNITPALGDAGAEITPNDSNSALDRQYNLSEIDTIFSGLVKAYPIYTNLSLPNEISDITAFYNVNQGIGDHSETGTGGSSGSSATLTLSLHSSSQGSASITPGVVAPIKEIWSRNISGMAYEFCLQSPISWSALLTRLGQPDLANTTVLQLPVFKPESITLVLQGQSVNLQASADVQQHVSISDSNVSATSGTGTGYSTDTGSTLRTVEIPPTLHPAITIASPTDSASVSASAAASLTGGTNWPSQSASITVGPDYAVASISPSSIGATSPTAIPTTGQYLTSLSVDPFFGFGWMKISAIVVDFSTL